MSYEQKMGCLLAVLSIALAALLLTIEIEPKPPCYGKKESRIIYAPWHPVGMQFQFIETCVPNGR